ncbi:CBS domain-containing protein [Gaetbulibacter sp. M235]|uniref:CBS domain-containing protein n=1 Tax=Gaetbulibacter sp. M235 TaxID=3126510 RepID=UPI00374EE8C1
MKTDFISTVMTKNVVSVTPEQSLLDVKHIYEKKKFHHHIPVVENEKLVGMVSLIDFMYNISGSGISDDNKIYKELKVKDIMTQKPFFLTASSTIEDVSKVLAEGYYHAIPILDNDKLAGIVSTADIIKFFLNEVK